MLDHDVELAYVADADAIPFTWITWWNAAVFLFLDTSEATEIAAALDATSDMLPSVLESSPPSSG